MSEDGSRGWEATPTGWRCTECHGEITGPIDVHIDDAHVCRAPATDRLRQLVEDPDYFTKARERHRDDIRRERGLPHDHGEYVAGCPRCDLSRAEVTPPPTREPIRLTDEEREALLFGFGIRFHENADHTRFAQGVAAVESILAARLAGGPTLADAWDAGARCAGSYGHEDNWTHDMTPLTENPYRTPESEDTE